MSLLTSLRTALRSPAFEEIGEFLGAKDVMDSISRKFRAWMVEKVTGEQWVRDIFSPFENPDLLVSIEKPKALPYAPGHISSIYWHVIHKTLDSISFLGEEIGSEAIMEMISESMSSALETNYNASLQTILNVWRGSSPPDLSVALNMGQRIDKVDINYALSILAPTSALPYTILESLVQGANQRFRELFTNVDTNISEYISLKNTYLMAHLSSLGEYITHTINTLILDTQFFIERLENYINTALTIILERLTALFDDLEAIETRHNTTDPSTGTPLLDDETYTSMLVKIDADVTGLQNTFNELQNEVNNAINDYTTQLDTIKDDIVTLIQNMLVEFENRINELINKSVNSVNNTTYLNDMKAKIKDIYERLRAYRECGFDYE